MEQDIPKQMEFWLKRKEETLKALEVAEHNIARLVMAHLIENSNLPGEE